MGQGDDRRASKGRPAGSPGGRARTGRPAAEARQAAFAGILKELAAQDDVEVEGIRSVLSQALARARF